MRRTFFVWLVLASVVGNSGAAVNFLEPLLSPDFNFTAFKAEKNGAKNSLKCPGSIEVAWRNSPPFVYKRREGTGSSKKLTGILHNILHRAFYICCHRHPRVVFRDNESHEKVLNRLLMDRNSKTAIVPVHSMDGRTYGGEYQFVKILNSPGIVLIMSKQEYSMKARDAVWLSLVESWPIVALTFMLAAIAGIIIWALDTMSNPEHFPRSFFRGILEGLWWSFVTMSTVGYGDRVPKSLCARLFGAFWIMIGLAVCSILTATLTSALTSISTDSNINILGQNIGVMQHNDVAYNEGIKQGAVIREFKSEKAMYESLTTTSGKDGILDEMHSGAFYVAKYKTHKLGVAKIFPREIPLGMAFRYGLLLNSTVDCLRKLFWLRENDILRYFEKYRKREDETTESIKSKEKDGAIINLFDGQAPVYQYLMSAVGICFLLLCILGIYFQIARCRRHNNSKKLSQDLSGKDHEITKRSLINDASTAANSNFPMASSPSKAIEETGDSEANV